MFTVGRRYRRQATDTACSFRHVPLFNFGDLADLKAHLPFGCRLIGVELDERARMLDGFAHPQQACYLLGAEDHGLTKEALDACHEIVQLPGERCLNVATAGSIVLYDRYVKANRAAS